MGSTTAEGELTTVHTVSGSMWCAPATLVEEASIGMESGPDEYLLGRVSGIAVDDNRIYLLDGQVPALRIYDLQGTHQRDIAPLGQGPGEFQRPDGFARATDGTLYVTDFSLQRIVSFAPDGTPKATVSVPGMYQSRPYLVDRDGTVFVRTREGIAGVAPDGSIVRTVSLPTFDREPWLVHTAPTEGFSAASFAVPFAPAAVWTLTPGGALAHAVSSDYRIEVESPNGQTLRIERDAALVPIEAAEKEWHERVFRAQLNSGFGPVQGAIPATPDHKPAMSRLIAGHDGTLWVVRIGAGVPRSNCAAAGGGLDELRSDPCWGYTTVVDAFSAEGRYLGEVALPEGVQITVNPVIQDGRVVAVFEDEGGTIMVKRYRMQITQ